MKSSGITAETTPEKKERAQPPQPRPLNILRQTKRPPRNGTKIIHCKQIMETKNPNPPREPAPGLTFSNQRKQT